MPENTPNFGLTQPIEVFQPENKRYAEVSLLDCNDSFTHNLTQAFLKLGAPVRVFRSHQVSLAQLEKQLGKYLVLSPGPGTPSEGGIAKLCYRELKGKLPILGVCLGMQTMNEVLGGATVSAPIPVHGKVSTIHHDGEGIFTDVPNPTPVARYHSLMIDPVNDLQVQSTFLDVIMAFRLPKYNTVAVQFHPESFLTEHGDLMLENFLNGVM